MKVDKSGSVEKDMDLMNHPYKPRCAQLDLPPALHSLMFY